MERTFTTVGHSLLKDTLKLRFTNDPNRHSVLERNGHTDINLVNLPTPMTKEQAAKWILDEKQFTAPVRQLAQDMLSEQVDVDAVAEQPAQPQQRRRPGRPKGSKNRPKDQAQAA